MTHDANETNDADADRPANTKAVAVRATGGRPLAFVAHSMDEAWRIAAAVCRAKMAPPGFDNEPEKCLVAIMQGAEVGLTPMQSLQRIAVINGRPTIWGDAAIGLVSASGLLEDFHETLEGEGEARVAVCRSVRKGRKTPIVSKFSVADARRAGLWDERAIVKKKDRAGNWYEKPNDAPWYRFPERMMQMRARGFNLRDGFADVLGGLYLREEIEDEPIDVTPQDQQPSRPSGPPRGVQEAKTIEHQETVTVDVAHGAADVEVAPSEEPKTATEVRAQQAEAQQRGDEIGARAPTVPGPPRGVSKAPAANPKKAYKWPEIEALFQNQSNMSVQMENLEPLADAHANLVDQYEFTPDELDALNRIYDEAERALN